MTSPYAMPPPVSHAEYAAPVPRRVVVRRVGVLSFAKFQGVVMALMGLVVGAIFALVFAAAGAAAGAGGAEGALLGGMGLMSILFFPVLYGGLGFVMGLVIGGIYNLSAGWMGGVELEVQ